MVKCDADQRPTMAEAASHPFFWDARSSLEKCRLARGKVDQRVEALHVEWIGKWKSLLPAEAIELSTARHMLTAMFVLAM